jgi:hypothetical protein
MNRAGERKPNSVFRFTDNGGLFGLSLLLNP